MANPFSSHARPAYHDADSPDPSARTNRRMPTAPTTSGASASGTVAHGSGRRYAIGMNGEHTADWNDARNGWPA